MNIASSENAYNTSSYWLRTPFSTRTFDAVSVQCAYEELAKAEKESSKGYTWVAKNVERELKFSDQGEFCADEAQDNDMVVVEDEFLLEFLGTFAIKSED